MVGSFFTAISMSTSSASVEGGIDSLKVEIEVDDELDLDRDKQESTRVIEQ